VHLSKKIFIWPAAVAALFGAFYAASTSAQPAAKTGRSTSVPPGYFRGSAGNDVLVGTNGDDVLVGLGGNDRIYGRGGNDLVNGGNGNDRLTGGSGRDSLIGGRGADRIYERDGQRDVVNGGPGFDEAWVDRKDVVTNVERVHRS
jgi:Ca2+-binding RTX toxin-like protein